MISHILRRRRTLTMLHFLNELKFPAFQAIYSMPTTARPMAPMAPAAMSGAEVGAAKADEVPVADSDAPDAALLADDTALLAVWERVAAALLWLAMAWVMEERTPESELATAPVAVESSELARIVSRVRRREIRA